MFARNEAVTLNQSSMSPELLRLRGLLEQGDVAEFNRQRPAGAIDLSRIEIPKDTNLSGVNLAEADLTGAELVSVNLSKAILTNANFTQANLSYAQLKGVNAEKANFDRGTLNHVVGSQGDFSEANFASAQMMRSTFEGCDFIGAKMPMSLLSSACFKNSDFTAAVLAGSRLKDTSFENACLMKANLARTEIYGTNFSSANMTSVNLRLAAGQSPLFRGACLHQAEVLDTILIAPDFSGAYVRKMSHNFGDKRDEFLAKALADQDADPKEFLQAKRLNNSSLIGNIPGTDGELLEQVVRQINKLTGLKEVKEKILAMIDGFKVNELRRSLGEPTMEFNQHLAFVGDPGTGKTTIGRLWGKVLKAFGYLESGHLIEVPGRELIAGKIGQSEEKTRVRVQEAMGGVLFVDEAHQLAKDSDLDFGREVLGTLNHSMTNYAGKLVVIFAGYTLNKIFEIEPGLKSRVTNVWNFPGYDSGDLMDILSNSMKDLNKTCSPEFVAGASLVSALARHRDQKQFGNARFICDNLMPKAVERQDGRNVKAGILDMNDAAKQRALLQKLEVDDLPVKDLLGIEPDVFLAALNDARWDMAGKKVGAAELPTLPQRDGTFPDVDPEFIAALHKKLFPEEALAA